MPKPTPAFVVPDQDLFDLVTLGETGTIKLALSQRREEVLEYRDTYNYSALHTACCYGHYDIAFELLEAGAEVNAQADFGDTPLHLASRWGHLDCVQLLLKRGADPSILNSDFASPLHLAQEAHYGRIVHILDHLVRSKVESSDPLVAATNGELQYFALAMMDGKKTELSAAETDNGDTLLILCCKVPTVTPVHLQIMKYLLSNNICSVNRYNKSNMTALMYAARGNVLPAVELLLEHGADASLTYDEEKTQNSASLATDTVVKAVLDVSLRKSEYDKTYGVRNTVPFDERADFIARLRQLKGELQDAEATLKKLKEGSANEDAEETKQS